MVGLIVADGANMALRVLYCLWFVVHTAPTARDSCSAAAPAATGSLSADTATDTMHTMSQPSPSSHASGIKRSECDGMAAAAGRLWQDLTPSSASLLSLVLAAAVVQTSGWVTGRAHLQDRGKDGSTAGSITGLIGAAIHVGVGASALLGVLYSLMRAEKPLWQQLRSLQGNSRREKKSK